MPSTLTQPERDQSSSGNDGGSGNWDDLKNLGGGDDAGPLEPERTPPPEGYRLAIRFTLGGVTVLFATLVFVYVFLGAKESALITPRLFWISTVIVTLCSLTLEIARRQLRRRRERAFQIWLYATLALGLVFLAAQYVALQQLVAAGFFAAKNLRAWLAFFITGTHAAHLIGGLLALIYLIVKSRYGDWTALRRRLSLDSTILYWHFIDVLWIFLFVMMFLWN